MQNICLNDFRGKQNDFLKEKTSKRKPLILRGSYNSGLQRHVSAGASMGVCLVDNTGVEMGKLGTVVEHGAGACYFIGVPVGADINGDELAAVTEHPAHVRYLACVPVRKVQGSKVAAGPEHAAHARYLAGIPSGNIQGGKLAATEEHAAGIWI